MEILEFIHVLMQVRTIADLISKLPLKKFAEAARKTHAHSAKHGLRPNQVDLIIELAVHLEKTKEILVKIAKESEDTRRLARNAQSN